MENLPIEIKIASVKSDLMKYLETTSKDLNLPPVIIVGVLTDILTDWKSKELICLNDLFNDTLNKISEELKKGNLENVQSKF